MFTGMHVGFGGVHAVEYLYLNGLLCGQKCVIPPITVEKPNLSMEKLQIYHRCSTTTNISQN